ncbi:diadenylate cyclase [Candidatus Pacearchaeota archaeon]|nr:diadenylate cyclase [Candidatus Pacearchaeota archaeon]
MLSILDSEEISNNLHKFIYEDSRPRYYPEECYLPEGYVALLKKCLIELYAATFLKEEGYPISFKVFLGDLDHVEHTECLKAIGRDDKEIKNNFTDLSTANIEFNAENIRKLALAANPKHFILIVNANDSKLQIKGLLYFSTMPKSEKEEELKLKIFNEDIFSVYDLKGFVFESKGIGSLSCFLGHEIFFIDSGTIIYRDYYDPFEMPRLLFGRNPLYEEIAAYFSNIPTIGSKLIYESILNALKRIEVSARGGTLIFINETDLTNSKNELEVKNSFIIPYEIVNKKDKSTIYYKYCRNKIIDFLFCFSQVDGAVVLNTSGIIGFGAKILVETKDISFPNWITNKGTRHRSAYALIEQSNKQIFACIVSADGGIHFVRKNDDRKTISYFYDNDNNEFVETKK